MTETQTTPVPRIGELRAAHTDALEAGRLIFQRCRSCGHAWLPPREECPNCLRDAFEWEEAGGRALLVSWCVYHRTPVPAFEKRVPYTVYLVELEEGPRLISSPASSNRGEPALGRALELVIEHEGETPLPRFYVV